MFLLNQSSHNQMTDVTLTECINRLKMNENLNIFGIFLNLPGKHFSYLIASEYFSISDNDNLPCHIDAHLPL